MALFSISSFKCAAVTFACMDEFAQKGHKVTPGRSGKTADLVLKVVIHQCTHAWDNYKKDYFKL